MVFLHMRDPLCIRFRTHDLAADCYGRVTEATSRAAMDTLSDALGL